MECFRVVENSMLLNLKKIIATLVPRRDCFWRTPFPPDLTRNFYRLRVFFGLYRLPRCGNALLLDGKSQSCKVDFHRALTGFQQVKSLRVEQPVLDQTVNQGVQTPRGCGV